MARSVEQTVVRVRGTARSLVRDRLAVEAPLEIRVRLAGDEQVISTTMRTPGDDRALVAGFLFAEGVISSADWLSSLESVGDDAVTVEFAASFAAAATSALQATQRRFVTSGACGVCGRASLDGLLGPSSPSGLAAEAPRLPRLSADQVHRLPGLLKQAQATFARTGGLHAAGIIATADGQVRGVHEDVGRHNAVDKLVGTLLLERKLPPGDTVLMVSGRASFELVQKAALAGFPIMAAVGAPSSLAVEVATTAGITLLGFVRDGGFNVYCGAERLDGLRDSDAGLSSST